MKLKQKLLFIFILFILFLSFMTSSIYAITMSAYFMTSSNFNVWGSGVQTTYADYGYSTVLKVGSATYDVKNGRGSGDGVNCNTRLDYVSSGNYVKISFDVTNTNSVSKTIGVASHADIQIASNDYAPISNLAGNRGFTMTDGRYVFNFLAKNSYGVTDVDTYWFGDYGIRTQNMWNNSQNYVYGGGNRRGDSGMAWSWQNRTIAPGQTLTFSALIRNRCIK